jgi:membrane peptidoglycan carboxypeptidase
MFMTGFAAKLREGITGALACWLCLFAPSLASAAWLGHKNDTQAAIAVQTSVVVNGKVQRGKLHVIHPGERVWDNIAAAGPQQISIMDPSANNKVLGQETINIANQDILLSVQWQAQPQVQGKAPVPPSLRLIPIKIVGPPGVVSPKADSPKEAPKTGPGTPIPPRTPLPPTSTPPDNPKAPPADKPKLPPSAEQPKAPPPSEKPKTPTEQPKTPPPAEQPKSKSGNDK